MRTSAEGTGDGARFLGVHEHSEELRQVKRRRKPVTMMILRFVFFKSVRPARNPSSTA